jgi:hypothetical protein
MNAKQFQRYLARDGGCIHCGESEAVAPHHRVNRGMGGSKSRDVPSNVIVMCSAMNTAMESDAGTAEQAREFGWKLRSFEDPLKVAVWHQVRSVWLLFDDAYGWVESEGDDEAPFFRF